MVEKDLRQMLTELLRSSQESITLIKGAVEVLKRIEGKLDQILMPAHVIRLPEHLRPAIMTVQELGDATADQVAERTGRSRGTESGCLNELVRLGLLKKHKVGRTAYFSLVKET